MANIIVIDDVKSFLEYVREILKNQGHTITCVSDSSKTFKDHDISDYDVVITDIFMPDVDGYEVMSGIKKMDKCPKILAMSAGSAAMDSEVALASATYLAADAVLKKPFSPNQLHETVEELLASA